MWGIAPGIALALCYPTWHLFPLAWLALAPFLYRFWRAGPKSCAFAFFLAGLAFHLVLLQWLLANVYWAGGWAVWGYAALSALMAAYWAATGAAWAWIRRRLPWIPPALVLAVLWAAMELVQGWAFSGFGWSALAYSQGGDLAVIQWAAVGGAPLVSALLAGFNALAAQIAVEKGHRIRCIVVAVVLLVVAHGGGALLLDEPDYAAEPLDVGLVQADFPLEMKWDPEYSVEMVRNAAEKSRLLAERHEVGLLVWPESLIMDELDTPGILDEVTGLCRDTGAALFAGSHRSNPATGGPLNSSYLIDRDGAVVDYYDKVHLAPFGEYVPLGDYLPFIQHVVPAIGAIEAGEAQKVLPVAGRRFGPLICFEVLFAPMAERLRQEGADFLIVVTNLGWFGHSNAI
ncbi:MAG: apolipoprotein N-acyltransferase, partial [Candidatus Hydrogenedentes bacterium]|nr:apolipoprotein N-acyltransferase [Candidatus Hydrogenedentota bacterium]